jgi:hypothetical protein
MDDAGTYLLSLTLRDDDYSSINAKMNLKVVIFTRPPTPSPYLPANRTQLTLPLITLPLNTIKTY